MKMRLFIPLLLLTLPVLRAPAEEASTPPPSQDDGPYVFVQPDALEAVWICDGAVVRRATKIDRVPLNDRVRLAVDLKRRLDGLDLHHGRGGQTQNHQNQSTKPEVQALPDRHLPFAHSFSPIF